MLEKIISICSGVTLASVDPDFKVEPNFGQLGPVSCGNPRTIDSGSLILRLPCFGRCSQGYRRFRLRSFGPRAGTSTPPPFAAGRICLHKNRVQRSHLSRCCVSAPSRAHKPANCLGTVNLRTRSRCQQLAWVDSISDLATDIGIACVVTPPCGPLRGFALLIDQSKRYEGRHDIGSRGPTRSTQNGNDVVGRDLRRNGLIELLTKLPPCTSGHSRIALVTVVSHGKY